MLLVAPALVTHGDMTTVVASSAPRLWLEQGSVRLALVQIGVDDLGPGNGGPVKWVLP